MLMLFLLKHNMFIEAMWYLHDNKWFGSHITCILRPTALFTTKLNGPFSYSLLHDILYDVNITIWPLQRTFNISVSTNDHRNSKTNCLINN